MRRLLAGLLLLLPPCLHAQATSPWEGEPSETTADLRGVHAVGGGVVWASGTGGTVLRSQDSGFEWQNCATPPDAEKLDFRAIWAWDDQTAIVMSSGPGALSRLYRTTDGCSHWTLLYTNPDKDGFWDALVFESRAAGRILGDPVDGHFVLLATMDGGKSWIPSGAPSREATSAGSGAFAASNSSLLDGEKQPLRFGTSGAYLYTRSQFGERNMCAPSGTSARQTELWDRRALPLANQGAAAGVFSLACRTFDDSNGQYTLMAVGGDYTRPEERTGTAAWSGDGVHWTASTTLPGGYRSAVAWDADLKLWITVGPNGSDISRDDGRTWQPLEHAPADAPKGGEWNALSLPWAVGPHGRIGKLNLSALPLAPSPRPQPAQPKKPAPVPR